MIRDILESLEEMQNQRLNFEFWIEWVPARLDINKNEKVYEEAKKAALEKIREEEPPPHRKLKSSQVTRIKDDMVYPAAGIKWTNGKENKTTPQTNSTTTIQNGGDTERFSGFPSKRAKQTLIRTVSHTPDCRLTRRSETSLKEQLEYVLEEI